MRNIRTILCAAMLLCAAGAWGQWVDLDAVIDATQFDTYKAKAEAGDAMAQIETAYCYEEGIGVEQDLREAFKWCTMSAKQGNAQAMLCLSNYYRMGQCTPKDEAYADELDAKVAEDDKQVREKARRGDVEAILHLAWGWDGWHGDKEIVRMCMELAESGNAKAQRIVGFYYEAGSKSPDGTVVTIETDGTKATEWYMKAALAGNAWAQVNIARLYLYGAGGLEKSPSKAVEWYTKASEQNEYKHRVAWTLADLGLHYMEESESMNRNPKVALKWLNMAAEQWDTDACDYLGDYYSGKLGWCGEVNGEKAIEYYERTVAVAYWYRCTYPLEKLADVYKRGLADADDGDTKMQEWFSRVQVQRDITRKDLSDLEECKADWDTWQYQNNPTKMYEYIGDSNEFNRLTNLAKSGNAKAQYYLGKYYAESKMGEGEQKTAMKWWKKAAKQGYKQAQDALEEMKDE